MEIAGTITKDVTLKQEWHWVEANLCLLNAYKWMSSPAWFLFIHLLFVLSNFCDLIWMK